ncbi:hypothetical protein ABT304_09080 [Nocardioides sp. NPDC000445]|uniref:McrC family protein n=1 Tax=Nocardioides sp. NPDC000445 TaxID=3154257 RepID=UPI0033185166
MTRHELPENDKDGLVLSLSAESAVTVAGTGLVDVQPYGHGTWRLVPRRNIVGAARVADLDLVVRPKAPFSSVLFMLGYASDPGFLPTELDGAADDDLWPALGETLARLGERALRQGVLQGYVTRDESLAVLRGRLRAADQVARRPGALLPLEVTYDEYEPDIAENRILLAALHRMSLVPRIPAPVRARLTHLAGRLDGVTKIAPGAPLPDWSRSRANVRYEASLRVSEVILRNVGISTSAGGIAVASFVVNMATVFEEFLTTALREAFRSIDPLGRTVAQDRDWLDEASRVEIKPDIIHRSGGEIVAVVDAKYKLVGSEGAYPNVDVYQMLAYCVAHRQTLGWLVYAGQSGASGQFHDVRNGAVRIAQAPVEVSLESNKLLSQVGALAAAILNRSVESFAAGQ